MSRCLPLEMIISSLKHLYIIWHPTSTPLSAPTWCDPLVFLSVVPQVDGGIRGHCGDATLDLGLQPHVTLGVMSKELLCNLSLLPRWIGHHSCVVQYSTYKQPSDTTHNHYLLISHYL